MVLTTISFGESGPTLEKHASNRLPSQRKRRLFRNYSLEAFSQYAKKDPWDSEIGYKQAGALNMILVANCKTEHDSELATSEFQHDF